MRVARQVANVVGIVLALVLTMVLVVIAGFGSLAGTGWIVALGISSLLLATVVSLVRRIPRRHDMRLASYLGVAIVFGFYVAVTST